MKERIYNFIVSFMTENGYSPSIREICDAIGVNSTSTIFNILFDLRDDGLINIKAGKARTISLVGYKLVKC